MWVNPKCLFFSMPWYWNPRNNPKNNSTHFGCQSIDLLLGISFAQEKFRISLVPPVPFSPFKHPPVSWKHGRPKRFISLQRVFTTRLFNTSLQCVRQHVLSTRLFNKSFQHVFTILLINMSFQHVLATRLCNTSWQHVSWTCLFNTCIASNKWQRTFAQSRVPTPME